jgi:hypothetical protein
MIKKLRKIALGTLAIAAVIALFATGPEVAAHQAQAESVRTQAHFKMTPCVIPNTTFYCLGVLLVGD